MHTSDAGIIVEILFKISTSVIIDIALSYILILFRCRLPQCHAINQTQVKPQKKKQLNSATKLYEAKFYNNKLKTANDKILTSELSQLKTEATVIFFLAGLVSTFEGELLA